jgi:hypothetical protein
LLSDFFCDFPLFLSFFKEKDKMAEEYDGKQKVKSMLAGGFGGICVVLSGHPFDTVKVSYFFPILKKSIFSLALKSTCPAS